MARVVLTLETLNQLDMGRVAEAWKQAVERCVRDCHDRPADERARQIMLQLDIRPVCDDSGMPDGASGEFKIKDKLPHRQSKTYSFSASKNGQLVFNEASDDDARQRTLDEGD